MAGELDDGAEEQLANNAANDRPIKANCLNCGEVRSYAATALHLMCYQNGETYYTYQFFCMSCRELQVRETDLDVFVTLESIGVPLTVVDVPLEMNEHPPETVAPLGAEDLTNFIIDLGQALDRRLGWPGDPGTSAGANEGSHEG